MPSNPSFQRVLHLVQQGHAAIVDRLITRVTERVPSYAMLDRDTLRSSVEGLLHAVRQALSTGQHAPVLQHIESISRDRQELGIPASDFMKALAQAFPVIREVLREVGPEDRTLAAEYLAFEGQLQELQVAAMDIYVATLHRALNEKNLALHRLAQHLTSQGTALKHQLTSTERALAQAQEFNHRVIESLSSGVAVLSHPAAEVQLWSGRMAEISEVPLEDALGRPIVDVAGRLGDFPVDNMFLMVRRTGRLPVTKHLLRLPSGRTRTVYVQAHRLYGPDGEVEGTVILLDDISERELLVDSFSRYVSRDLLQRLLARGRTPGLDGELRECTVLFADIRGFTTLAEGLDPAQLHEMLNAYFRVMVAAVTDHGGFIDKFVGDKIMALFTAEEAETAARAAVRAAADLLSRMETVSAERRAAGREPIEVGVGINTGQVMLGNVGAEARMDFTAIGDAVNVADRLQGLAPGGSVVVGDRTARLCENMFNFEDMQDIPVKGRQGRVRAWKLLRTPSA